MLACVFLVAQIVCGGLVTNVVYDLPTREPIWFGGESRAADVNAKDYCVFADVYYEGGGALWARMAAFSQGSHCWERSANVCVPKKPVKRIALYAFVRDGTGRADFRHVFLWRCNPPKGERLLSRRYDDGPMSGGDVVCEYVWNGKGAVCRETKVPAAAGRRRPVAVGAALVWTADSMARVTPLTFPSDAVARRAAIELARNERESFQVVVTAGEDAGLDGVALEISPLKDSSGRVLRGGVKWERVACIPRRPGAKGHPFAAPREERWIPEPLLPAAPFSVRGGSSRAAWVTVSAAADAAGGEYAGEIRVVAGSRLLATVPVKATVWGFALPERFGLRTSFSYMDGFARPLYHETWNARRREAHDILLDHRLNPDDISRTDAVLPDDVAHMKSRGASAWNLMQIAPPKGRGAKWLCRPEPGDVFRLGFYESFTNRLAPCVAELRRRGLMDGAYVYGFDECKKEYYAGMRELYAKLKRDFPDLPVLTTARMFNDVCEGRRKMSAEILSADWYCGSLHLYRPGVADEFRKAGRSALWYTCVSPDYPYLNFANVEYPQIEGRLLLGCATWLCRSDGFLFWHVNYWRGGKKSMLDERQADPLFENYDVSDVRNCPGDGVLLYPGKNGILPGVRLANIRDGEEDWELLALAERSAGRAAVEKAVREVVRSPKDFSRSPECLRTLRRRLAGMVR